MLSGKPFPIRSLPKRNHKYSSSLPLRSCLGMDKQSSFEARRVNFLRAAEHGLDLRTIAKNVTQKSIDPILYRTGGILESFEYPPSDSYVQPADKELIRGLEWLTMVKSTYPDALMASNTFLRYFLAENKVETARHLLTTLPADLAEVCAEEISDMDEDDDDPEGEAGLLKNEILEFKLHNIFSNTVASLETAESIWGDEYSEERSAMMKSEMMAWSRKNEVSADRACVPEHLEFLADLPPPFSPGGNRYRLQVHPYLPR